MSTPEDDRERLRPLATGAQVVLRRFLPSDLDAFCAYRADPDVGRFQGWAGMAREEAAEFIAAMGAAPLFSPGEWSQLAIAERGRAGVAGALRGDIGIRIEADESAAELGITLSRQAQGRGLGLDAARAAIGLIFRATPVARILAISDARNAPSLALIRRLGFAFTHSETDTTREPPLVELFHVLQRGQAPGSGG